MGFCWLALKADGQFPRCPSQFPHFPPFFLDCGSLRGNLSGSPGEILCMGL